VQDVTIAHVLRYEATPPPSTPADRWTDAPLCGAVQQSANLLS
jgi:hypothetical protein